MPIGAFCAFLGSVRLVRYFTDFLGHVAILTYFPPFDQYFKCSCPDCHLLSHATISDIKMRQAEYGEDDSAETPTWDN